jgi:hypothetical protein
VNRLDHGVLHKGGPKIDRKRKEGEFIPSDLRNMRREEKKGRTVFVQKWKGILY